MTVLMVTAWLEVTLIDGVETGIYMLVTSWLLTGVLTRETLFGHIDD